MRKLQCANLKFGDRRDDRRLGFEVGQVHGSGEQQQRWRNIFFQVQVEPLDGAQHVLQTDEKKCKQWIYKLNRKKTKAFLIICF